MLDALRKQATGWVAQIFIGLLVLSFAVWGVSGFFTGFYADTVATVGKTDIPATAFARQYDQALQAMTRQTGRPVSAEQARLLGVPSQILGRLVTQATLDDTARQYGIGVSNEVLARQIAEDPAFRGFNGSFDRLKFQQALRTIGYTEDQFVTDQHDVVLRYQLSNALLGEAHAPEPYLEALHQYRSEQRNIDYIVLSPANAGDIGEPDAAELESYFEDNKSRWRAPEYRGLSLFEVTPADIADPDEITDEQAQAAYDRRIDQYSEPERRKLAQIVFESEEAARTAEEAIIAGKAFDDVASEMNLSQADIDLGLVARKDIIDPKVADAAFSLSSGATSPAVEGGFGWVIVRVDDIQPGETTSFDEVKDDIKRDLALDLAKKRLIETFDQVEDARAAGETFLEIANKIRTPLETIAAVDNAGNDPDGEKVASLPTANDLLPDAFASDVGIENDAVRTAVGGYVWYEVTDITPERERSLDEVREKVIAEWQRSKIDDKLTAEAEKILSRLQSGEPFADIASELLLTVDNALFLTRTSTPPVGLTVAAIRATFGGPEGHVAVTEGSANDGSKAVLVVTNVSVPAFDATAPELVQVRRQLSDQIANDYLQQFIVEKQNQLGVRVNQTTLEALVGQIRPGL